MSFAWDWWENSSWDWQKNLLRNMFGRVTQRAKIWSSKMQSLQSSFSLLFLPHAHALSVRLPLPHRCVERFAVVFGVCWKRSTSRNKSSAQQSWQTGTETHRHPQTAVTLIVLLRRLHLEQPAVLMRTCLSGESAYSAQSCTRMLCIPTLAAIDVTAAGRLSKHSNATATSDRHFKWKWACGRL